MTARRHAANESRYRSGNASPAGSLRTATLCLLLRLTDELRAQILGGRLLEAAGTEQKRERILRRFLATAVDDDERTAMVEVLCAMLEMDGALLRCLELNRSQAIEDLVDLSRQKHELRAARSHRQA